MGGRSVIFVTKHFEHITDNALVEFSSNSQKQCQARIGIIFSIRITYTPLQSVKCVTKNIYFVNYIHLIYLDWLLKDPFRFRMVLGNVSKPCEVLCGVLIMLLL